MIWRLLFLFLTVHILSNSILTAKNQTVDSGCDSAKYFIDQFDNFERVEFDTALYFINEAIEAAIKCNQPKTEVSYSLDKADFLFSNGDTEAAISLSLETIVKARETQDSLTIGKSLRNYGEILVDLAQYDSAIILYEQSFPYILASKDSIQLSDYFVRKGIAFDRKGFYEKALTDYYRALEISVSIGDTIGIGKLYNNIAIVYKRQDDVLSATRYYQKAIELSRLKSDDYGIAIINVNLGLIAKDQNSYHKADSLLNSSLAYFLEDNDYLASAVVMHNLGELKRKEGEISQALEYYQKSNEYAKDHKNFQLKLKNNFALAELYFNQGEIEASFSLANKCMALAEELDMLKDKSDVYLLLSEIYELKENPYNALLYYKKHEKLKGTIFNENKTQIINQLKAKYESDQKDAQIEILQKEQVLHETAMNSSVKQKRFFIILSISLFATFSLLAYGFFKSKKYSKKLSQQHDEILYQKQNIESNQQELISKNDALEKLSKEKDDLINIVAHDLRSPLNHVKGLIAILKFELDETINNTIDDYFGKIDYSVNTLRDRINRILDVEMINSNNVIMKLEPVRPTELLQSIDASFKDQAKSKGIRIINKSNGISSLIKVDLNYTLQIMENLVSNAIKFSKAGEDIELDTTENKGHIRLHVKDSGPGLSEKDQQKLFHRYTRLTAQPTANEKSTGLGLSIVKKYVENMNGKVWCESKFGEGAEFIVEFPQEK